MDKQSDYYLILADIKSSSSLSAERAGAAMSQLLPQLERQNQRLRDDIIYPLEVNYGDQFRGLFSSPRAFYQIVSDVRDALRGTAEFRFVTARGRIDNSDGTLRDMRGPVFETASRALTRLKKKKQFSDWQISDSATNQALTAMTNAAAALIDEMTPYQHIVYMFQKAGLKGTEIAEKLSKDPRSISNAKKTGHCGTVIQIEQAMAAMLANLERGKEHASAREFRS
ncbi:MAG: SatD family protein [Pseudomonadota bacterium]